MTALVLASILFILLHRVVSGGSLRGVIVRRIGEKRFQRTFALASVAALAGLWLAYQGARGSDDQAILPAPALPSLLLQAPMQIIAIFLIVAGLSTPSPTIAGMGERLRGEDAARGVLRITRHPFLWGIALFSVGHLLATPRLASWLFFGSLLLVALTGAWSIDAKRRRAFGADWARFEAQTSNLPFAAILGGRQVLKPAEIGLWRPIAALGLSAALVLSHRFIAGVGLT